MVGVRSSNRCENCRIRKKKCDEKEPACSECIRSGWPCPGYSTNKTWKFVDEAPKLADHYAGRKFVYDTVVSNQGESSSANDFGSLDNPGARLIPVQARPEVPRSLELNPLVPAFVYCLKGEVSGFLVPLSSSGAFYDFIPSRLGHNVALDDAVSCMSTIYRKAPLISFTADRDIYQRYVKALASLRGHLNDPFLAMAPETLCASILLHMSECVVSTGTGDWGNLAQGTSSLLRSRGVQNFSSEFEQAMLESQLPHVFGQSMKLKEHCFLSSPEWRDLFRRNSQWAYTRTQPASFALRTGMMLALSELPSLVIYHSQIRTEDLGHREQREHIEMLISKVSAMLQDMRRWLEREAEPMFISYTPSPDGLQKQINYPDILSGISDCVGNTALMSLDKMLRSLCRIRDVASVMMGENVEMNQHFDSPEVIEGWRRRALFSFESVRAKSTISAKPLAFGLRQIQIRTDDFSIEI